jgi:NADPH:quinone reductase-like Zn-dependent oxidoreductase
MLVDIEAGGTVGSGNFSARAVAGLAVAAFSVAFAPAGVASPKIPSTMRAIRADTSGAVQMMTLQTVDVPSPKEGQVLIKVHAASINPADWQQGQNRGARPGGAPGAAPASPGAPAARAGGPMAARLPGNDAAGVVVAIGPGVTAYKVGDKVLAALQPVGGGAYAEYALASIENMGLKPKKFTFEQAAGLPTAGFTGLRMVIIADVHKGDRVLVIGAAGGVGSAAVQSLKARGAYVITSASYRHNAYLKKLGADQIIAYDQQNVADLVKNVDAVISTVGSENTAAVSYVKPGGRVITIAGQPDLPACSAAGVTCVAGGPGQGPANGELIRELVRMADDGRFSVSPERSFPLAEVQAAYEYARTGNREGKIVIDVTPQARQR